jgi:PAS domain-containing protein
VQHHPEAYQHDPAPRVNLKLITSNAPGHGWIRAISSPVGTGPRSGRGRTRAFPVQSTSESARRLVVIGEDVTEQRQAQRKLRVFTTTSDQAVYGSAIVDGDWKIMYVNEPFAPVHGRSCAEINPFVAKLCSPGP